MAFDYRVQCFLESNRIESTFDDQVGRPVVDREPRFQLLKKPEPLLGIRKRGRFLIQPWYAAGPSSYGLLVLQDFLGSWSNRLGGVVASDDTVFGHLNPQLR